LICGEADSVLLAEKPRQISARVRVDVFIFLFDRTTGSEGLSFFDRQKKFEEG